MAHKYPKRPKAPKKTASLATWERYNQRLSDWEHKCKAIDQAKSRKASLISSTQKKAATIAGKIGRR